MEVEPWMVSMSYKFTETYRYSHDHVNQLDVPGQEGDDVTSGTMRPTKGEYPVGTRKFVVICAFQKLCMGYYVVVTDVRSAILNLTTN